MRLSVIFLALQLAFVALVPCRDLGTQSEADAAHTELADHEEPGHEDNCPPLCSCVCCGILADTPPLLVALAKVSPPPPTGQTRPNCSPDWKIIYPDPGQSQPPRA